ncbi:uncharacterized protein LOC108101996 [Drosophila ficusphila]|uniref:uncharacterized protein LOC108101996 n=1 Tax=Drosophila ficusphila TaxID=30025 RepID=UPI0007E8849D|nr:uncharacterized protein LOC108101996 [Drosophila ficusphila]
MDHHENCPQWIKIEQRLNNLEKLDQLENDAEANQEALITLFKNMLGGEGVVAGLRRLISDDVLYKMNYSGKMGQVGLTKFSNFTNVLYESLRNEHYSYRQFQDDFRTSFTKAKNKKYKNSYKKKKTDFQD